jgi:hypothetical protein
LGSFYLDHLVDDLLHAKSFARNSCSREVSASVQLATAHLDL